MGSAWVTVTVESVTTVTDKYGDTTETTVSADYPRCLFAPRSSQDRSNPRVPSIITGATVYFTDPGAAIGPDDVLTVRGKKYVVDGEVGDWQPAGLEVAVKRWEQPS